MVLARIPSKRNVWLKIFYVPCTKKNSMSHGQLSEVEQLGLKVIPK